MREWMGGGRGGDKEEEKEIILLNSTVQLQIYWL